MSDPLVIISAIVFFIAALWFVVESFLYIRHIRRMKRIWEDLEKALWYIQREVSRVEAKRRKLDLKPKE